MKEKRAKVKINPKVDMGAHLIFEKEREVKEEEYFWTFFSITKYYSKAATSLFSSSLAAQ